MNPAKNKIFLGLNSPPADLRLEPGLIGVFRFYAMLRLGFLFFIPLIAWRLPARLQSHLNLTLTLGIMSVEYLTLLGYLYSGTLQRRLGRHYLPVGLAFGFLGLVIDQRLLSLQRFFWEAFPFAYILLILVAWQYHFRVVLLYTLGLGLIEILMELWLPGTFTFEFLSTPETQRLFFFAVLFFRTVSFLLLGYVVTRLASAQRRQRRDLAAANRKLVYHAATVEQLAVSQERNRLSRELHDTLAHTLSALAVQLDAVLAVWDPIPAPVQGSLEEMLATTRQGLADTRRALGELRASPLEELGLRLALQALAEDIARRANLALKLDLPDSLEELPFEIEQCAYRVAQESLENIIRHADARSLEVRLRNGSRKLVLEIEDNGRGFDPRQVGDEDRFGLRGMQERAERVGAQLAVTSRPGAGTKVRLVWEPGIAE